MGIVAINGGRAEGYPSTWIFDNLDWGPRKSSVETELAYFYETLISVGHFRGWESFLPDEAITKADTILARSARLALLNGWCTFRNETLVSSYLRSNAYLIDLTFEAITEVRLAFPLEVSFELEVMVDPESENPPHLFLLIGQTGDPDPAIDALEAFYDHWWLDNLSRARGMMTVGLL